MTVEIIARIDTENRKPVVFFPNTMNEANKTIDCWIDGVNQVAMLDYYHSTRPLSAADEEIVRARYSAAIGGGPVAIRHRLPRVSRVPDSILAVPRNPDPLAPVKVKLGASLAPAGRSGAPIPGPITVSALAPAYGAAQATPGDVMTAIQALGAEFNERLAQIAQKLTPSA